MNYWEECIYSAADECGLSLTKAQAECLAGAVEVGHENYGMAHGYDVIGRPSENQAQAELRELKLEIQKKKDWVLSTRPCRRCTTTGTVLDSWLRDMTCPDCGGGGRVRL
jgi:hypothetical protein